MLITIRPERSEDHAPVRQVNEQAFGQPQEAHVVDKLRAVCDDVLSLVAEWDGQVVGHVLFTPVVFQAGQGVIRGMGLAPLAVTPQHQRQGIGTALVKAGLAILRDSACPAVIVLGHPDYYPRFGFEPASRHGIRSQWEGVPADAFMILIFDPVAMAGACGVARYRDEFDEAM